MIQQSFDGDFLLSFVVLVVSAGETALSTTGKKRAGGSWPPHSIEEEGPAPALAGAGTLDDGDGVARGSARITGLSMAGAGVMCTGGLKGLPASAAMRSSSARSSAAAITS